LDKREEGEYTLTGVAREAILLVCWNVNWHDESFQKYFWHMICNNELYSICLNKAGCGHIGELWPCYLMPLSLDIQNKWADKLKYNGKKEVLSENYR